MRLLAPSILAADFLHLEEEIAYACRVGDMIHVDVMDGVLVSNISFGFPVAEAVARVATKPLDIHLMIVEPWKYFERFAAVAGRNGMVSFHLEAARMGGKNPSELLGTLKSLGVKAGLVINPDIPVEDLFPYVKEADYILLMSVFAGFGGQKFIPETCERVRKLRKFIRDNGLECLVEVDGGVDKDNADLISGCGVDIMVAGSAVFRGPDREASAKAVKGCN